MRIFIILTALLLPFSVHAATCDAGYQLNYSTKTCVACPTGTYSDGSAILLDPNIIGTSYDISPLSTGDGTWSTEYSYGTVSGIASCNSTTAISLTDIYDYNFEAGVSGPSCWCKMTSPANSKWILTGTAETNSLCAQYCATTCGRNRDENEIRKPMYNSVACQSCTNAPANAHYTGSGTTATNCPWECDAGYYGSSANGDTSCSACGNGYFCTGGTNREFCRSVINYAGTIPDATAIYSIRNGDWANREHAASPSDCICDFYFHDETRYMYQYEARCFDGPIGYQFTHYYWCNTGYYASNPLYYNDWYSSCNACDNAPANSHYTSYSTPSEMYAVESNCPWQCDSGYGRTANDTCEPLCAAGITTLRTSTGLIYNLYANKLTSPAIHIQQNGITCYVNLVPGGATGAINIRNNGTVYHATN